MSGLCIDLPDEAAQEAFGERLARVLRPGLLLFLQGELGAGKTTLARGIARGLGHRGAVKSPTYTIVEPYRDLAVPLYHFDLYRLGDAEELEYLGIRDYFSGAALLLVEWPERGRGVLPAPDLRLRLEVLPSGRRLQADGESAAGRRCLRALAALEAA